MKTQDLAKTHRIITILNYLPILKLVSGIRYVKLVDSIRIVDPVETMKFIGIVRCFPDTEAMADEVKKKP